MDPLVVADWGGSIAGAISIVFLLRKSLGYWYWSIVATLLWLYLFIETESLMVAGLQLFYTAFAVYGIARWHLERRSLAVPRRLDPPGPWLPSPSSSPRSLSRTSPPGRAGSSSRLSPFRSSPTG